MVIPLQINPRTLEAKASRKESAVKERLMVLTLELRQKWNFD